MHSGCCNIHEDLGNLASSQTKKKKNANAGHGKVGLRASIRVCVCTRIMYDEECADAANARLIYASFSFVGIRPLCK